MGPKKEYYNQSQMKIPKEIIEYAEFEVTSDYLEESMLSELNKMRDEIIESLQQRKRLMDKLQEHIEYKANVKAWLKHIKA